MIRAPGKVGVHCLIVINSLDEYQNADIQCYIVRIFWIGLIRHKLPLFILVASHPEAHIHNSFNSYNS